MRAIALGLLAAVAWAFHDICVRFVSQKTQLMAALFTVLIATLVFHLSVMTVQDAFAPMERFPLLLAILSGAFFLIASLGLYAAFQRGPVRLVAPVIASLPILSVTVAALRGIDVTGFQILAVFSIVCGVSRVAALSDTVCEQCLPKGLTILFASIAAVGFVSIFALEQMAVGFSDELSVTLVTRITAIVGLLGIMMVKGVPLWPGRSALPILCLMGLADGVAVLSVFSAGHLPDAQYAAVAASVFGLWTI